MPQAPRTPPAEMPPHRAIELHDSDVVALRRHGPDVAIDMSFYVHASDGVPGEDAGSGWTWAGEIRVTDAVVDGEAPETGLWVLDGSVVANGQRSGNLLPLPFSVAGQVRVALEGADGVLTVSGSSATVIQHGDPTFVEAFP